MISIKDVTFGYSTSAKVLEDFSLQFQDGGVYGLLGKNGTGKSTLLYLITGLLRAQKGSVEVDGVDARDRNAEILSEIFIVPEEYDLPAISLNSYVKAIKAFYPRFSGELLEKCLREFEMPTEVNLGSLSMGQKKKVYICIALAANTKYLLLDEPTNGLDILSKSLFRKVVVAGMSEEKTLIISTHQVHDVELLLDHVVIIDRNRVLLDQKLEESDDAPIDIEKLFIDTLTNA
ncbi:MAG: ATP-binding cassette domain-containing protein [Bacteroidaceae bacterium]|nr:ATP-binding cassette domain-containing protein [Bacteroidaceae bacterium]